MDFSLQILVESAPLLLKGGIVTLELSLISTALMAWSLAPK